MIGPRELRRRILDRWTLLRWWRTMHRDLVCEWVGHQPGRAEFKAVAVLPGSGGVFEPQWADPGCWHQSVTWADMPSNLHVGSVIVVEECKRCHRRPTPGSRLARLRCDLIGHTGDLCCLRCGAVR